MAWQVKGVLITLGMLSATLVQGASLFCCQDPVSGRRACGDSLPEQCRGRAYKVLDGAGNVVKEVGPPLTAEQKAQAEAEVQRKKEQEAAQREQRRKDQALLDTYSSLQDIDTARSRSEANIQEAVKRIEAKIAILHKQRKKLEEETDFYRKKGLPPEIEKGLRDTDSEIKANASLLDIKRTELDSIRAKYDEDKRRYLQLTGGR